MRLILVLLAAPLLAACMTTAQYSRYKDSVGDLSFRWQDEQDRAACTKGGVLDSSMEYLQCRLAHNAARAAEAKAEAAKAEAAKAAKAPPAKP